MEEQQTPAGAAPPPAPPAPSIDPKVLARMETERRMISGADWFFWIAGLSLINSIIILANGKVNFPVGLGITQIVDSLVKESNPSAAGFAMVFDLILAGFYVFLGVSARKRQFWAFVVGMVLYALDALLFLPDGMWWSIAFHAFALFGIFNGYKAAKALLEMERPPVIPRYQATPPPAQSAVMPPPYQPTTAQPEPVQQSEAEKAPAETAE